MKKKNLFVPYSLVICMLFASITMVGCSTKHEPQAAVIEKSTPTTIDRPVERPVIQEKRTTTTTTESQQ